MESLLSELVELSSHTADAAGCSAVAARLDHALGALTDGGLSRRLIDHGGKFGQHLWAESAAPGPAVLLVGHHDTVFPKSAFVGYREDGALLRGPGVLDMKGGLVVIAYALAALARADLLRRVPVILVSVSDEEVGSPEGAELVRAGALRSSAALVFESGRQNDLLITRRKGTGALTVTARGKAAHAGNLHHEGKNAIWALAKFIDGAQRLTDYDAGCTVNVGKISGGIGKNTVPDAAEALVDFRFIDAAQGAALMTRFAAAAATAADGVPGTSVELAGGIQRPPLERTEASSRLLAEYGACASAFGLGSAEAPLLGGGSDANTVAALGVPALDGLGPRGKGFHTTDEFIERATLVPKAQALCRFLVGRAVS